VPAIDDLYRSVAAIDYSRRLCDYGAIFLKLNRCIFLLEYQEEIRRWRERRGREREAAIAKQQRMSMRSTNGSSI
jgi:pantothenate kinase-related protein Tda10